MSKVLCPYYSCSVSHPQSTGWVTDDRDYSFSEINELICGFQIYLQELGLRPGDTIALDSENSPHFLAMLFAAQRNRLRSVILGVFSSPSNKLDAVERSSAKIISLSEVDENIILLNYSTKKTDHTGVNVELNYSDIPIILFTSGSTGKEKGVSLSVRNLILSAIASNECTKLDINSNWLSSLTFARIGGLAIAYRCAVAAATLTFSRSLSGNDLLETIETKNISHVSLVPVQLDSLLEDEIAIRKLKKLRAILLGGAPASEKLLNLIVKYNLPVLTTYGMTETTSHISLASLGDPVERVFTSGKILKHSTIKLVCLANQSEITEPNIKGLLLVKGDTVSPGYIDKVGSEKFSTEGWFNTGDIAYLDNEKQLNIIGRSDDMIISGGINIYLHEIEVAAENIEGVVNAAVIGVDHEKWGKRPILFVVAPNLEIDFIYENLKAKLDKVKIPDQIILLAEMPRISIGKVDYQFLRKLFQSDNNG